MIMADEEKREKQEEEEEEESEEEEEKEDYKEKMLRIAAEFDNYKKRTKNETENARRLGKAEIMKGLLPVLDEFELAIISANGNGDKNIVKGIEMVYSNLSQTLKREGLSEIKSEGTYDPYKHEIMMTKESTKKPGTILEVVKKGYSVGDTILRPASVIIAKEKPKENEKEKEKENNDNKNETK